MALCEGTLRVKTHPHVGKHVVGRDASCGETLHVERRFARGTVSHVL